MIHRVTYRYLGKEDDEYIPPNCTKLILTDVSKLEFLCNFLQSNTTIKTIDLQGQTIGPKGAKEIAKALRVNHTVTDVNLSYCSIGDEGAKAIAKALKVNCTIKILNLGGNKIRNDGANEIAKSMQFNRTITYLLLADNYIGDEGSKAIVKANCTVLYLSFWNNRIGHKVTKAIAEVLKLNFSIETLDLGNNDVGVEGAKAIAEALKVNCILTQLNSWDLTDIQEIQDELNINLHIRNELPKMELDLKCKTMTLGLLQRVPVYLLLDIHELVVILDLEHKTNSHKFYSNNYFLKLFEKNVSRKRLLGMMDKINRKLI